MPPWLSVAVVRVLVASQRRPTAAALRTLGILCSKAMGPETTWSDIQVEQQLTVKGGLLTSPMAIKAKRVEVAGNGNRLTFVKLCK